MFPVYDQSSILAKTILAALERDFPLGIDIGVLKGFNLFRLAHESFSGAPGSLTTGDMKGRALLKRYRFKGVEGED